MHSSLKDFSLPTATWCSDPVINYQVEIEVASLPRGSHFPSYPSVCPVIIGATGVPPKPILCTSTLLPFYFNNYVAFPLL